MALGANKAALLGAAGSSTTSAHTIDQSIRFNTSDNPFMGRTPSATGTEETWTWSFWIKRASLGTLQLLFQIGADKNNCDQFAFNTSDQLQYQHLDSGGTTDSLVTTQLFRDISAWYHIVLTADTTNAVETERIRIYVNGARVTDFSGTPNYPTQNTPTDVNTQVLHQIGAQLSAAYYSFDGYMAEIVFLDGTATTCNSFGEFNSSGIWIPKSVSGLTFGTNGFHIDGRDASGSPVKLGDDESGNDPANNYTTSGMDATDQKKDSPTNIHATWNPLTTSAQAYTNGNLNAASSSSAWKGGLATVMVPLNSGTWYYEVYIDSAGSSSGQFSVGWSESIRSLSDDNSSGDAEGWVTYAINGLYYANGGTGSYGATYTSTNVIGCKINTNSTSNNVEFYKDGASQGTLSQAFNTGGSGFISPYILLYGTRNGTARFAQAEWTQTPSGITEANAINTTNLGS